MDKERYFGLIQWDFIPHTYDLLAHMFFWGGEGFLRFNQRDIKNFTMKYGGVN